jgi:ABC-type transporter Mla MlaB component
MTGELLFEQPSEEKLLLILSGRWKLEKDLPTADEVVRKLEDAPEVSHIDIDAHGLDVWDSGLLVFLTDLRKYCSKKKIRLKGKSLPQVF